jgi:hypothetical protein
MISFRLTAEEYEQFRELCFKHGSRSVSELARTAVHSLLNQPAAISQAGLESRIMEVEGRLHMLALEVRRLIPHGPDDQTAGRRRARKAPVDSHVPAHSTAEVE